MLSLLWLSALTLLCSNTSFEYTAQTAQNCITSFAIEKAILHSNLDQIVNTVNLAYQRQPFNRKDYPRITADALKELLENEQNQLNSKAS